MAKRKVKTRKAKSIDFELIGKDLAKILDVRRRLIEGGFHRGDSDYARRALEDIRTYIRLVRQGLETQLGDGDLDGLTPENARQAIYSCQIFEDRLQVDHSEISH